MHTGPGPGMRPASGCPKPLVPKRLHLRKDEAMTATPATAAATLWF